MHRTRAQLLQWVVLGALLIMCSIPAGSVRGESRLRPRLLPDKAADRTLRQEQYSGNVVIKFREGSAVRLKGEALISQNRTNLSAVQNILNEHALQPARLLTRPEETLAAERLAGEIESGQTLADLNLYYVLHVADASEAAKLVDELNTLDVVEIAYLQARAYPAGLGSGDKWPTTPDLTAGQGYLYGPASNGINAVYAWTVAGGKGEDTMIIDVEAGWRLTHEDFKSASSIGGVMDTDSLWFEHGTAVLGELVGAENSYGITGIAPSASFGLQSIWIDNFNWSYSEAIDLAASHVASGDVVLIELQTSGPSSGEECTCNCEQFELVPIEWDYATYDVIANATARGVIVVEAAANGGMNLDSSIYNYCSGQNCFNSQDSGAIMVGAGYSNEIDGSPARSPHCFSNYGQRVNVQGWGNGVVTTGYGDGWNAGWAGGDYDDGDQWYASGFSGTSSASPIVAGSALCLQGIRKAAGMPLLNSRQMRSLLRTTGTAQTLPARQIGPLPNLQAAYLAMLSESTSTPTATPSLTTTPSPTVTATKSATATLTLTPSRTPTRGTPSATPRAFRAMLPLIMH